MLLNKSTKKNSEQTFWNWFSKNADKYYHFEKDQSLSLKNFILNYEKFIRAGFSIQSGL
jgi:hypothetical protein